MKRYRKKPVVIEATQWLQLGDHPKVERPWENKSDYRCEHCGGAWGRHGVIRTLEDTQNGGHFVCPGDWIIKGVAGEFYACKPDIFWKSYEPADDAAETDSKFSGLEWEIGRLRTGIQEAIPYLERNLPSLAMGRLYKALANQPGGEEKS